MAFPNCIDKELPCFFIVPKGGAKMIATYDTHTVDTISFTLESLIIAGIILPAVRRSF